MGAMHVVVGSMNPVKVEATQLAFAAFFGDVEVEPLNVASGVKPFPTSEEETLQGALNRARAVAAARPEADYSVGIEAGIVEVAGYRFVRAYAAVLRDGELGLGGSAAFQVPPRLLARIDPEREESKQAIDQELGRTNVFRQEGAVGILTRRRLDRTTVLRDAVICALAPHLNPRYYREEENRSNPAQE